MVARDGAGERGKARDFGILSRIRGKGCLQGWVGEVAGGIKTGRRKRESDWLECTKHATKCP